MSDKTPISESPVLCEALKQFCENNIPSSKVLDKVVGEIEKATSLNSAARAPIREVAFDFSTAVEWAYFVYAVAKKLDASASHDEFSVTALFETIAKKYDNATENLTEEAVANAKEEIDGDSSDSDDGSDGEGSSKSDSAGAEAKTASRKSRTRSD